MLQHERSATKKTVTKTVLVTVYTVEIDILNICNMVVSVASIDDVARMDGDTNG